MHILVQTLICIQAKKKNMNIKEGCIEILYSNCKLIHTACSLRVTRILLLEFAKFVRMFRSQALSHDFSAVYTNLPP